MLFVEKSVMITVIDETTNDSTAGSASPTEQSPSEQNGGVASCKDNSSIATQVMCSAAKQGQPATMEANPPPSNSNLMSRLRNFLPQMQSANHELLSTTTSLGTDLVRLDTNLKPGEDSDSDSDNDTDNDETKTSNPLIQEVGAKNQENNEEKESSPSSKETPNKAEAAPTIQLEFTLGNMTGNPLMKLLSNDGDSDDDSTSSAGDKNDGDPTVAATTNAVVNLLTESNHSTTSEKKNSIVLLDSITGGSTDNGSVKSNGKKRLITELS